MPAILVLQGRQPVSLCRRAAAAGPCRRTFPEARLQALVAGLLITLALVLAPDAPQDQAAICQRHNGPVACRVW